MAEKSIPALLNEIWSDYRRAGITDDLRIIESLATLLLEQAGIPLSSDLPRKAQTAELEESKIRKKLIETISLSKSTGDLFDRYILFRLPKMRQGQYPTPRHIVRLMTSLAKTPGKTIADFACGSAGLLIYSGGTHLTGGVEISPEWARLARANLHLHGIKGEIEEGDALRILKDHSKKYACILMNPPFGAKVSSTVSARSETALTNLALNQLSKDGYATLLVPSGLLFSGSQAENQLRQKLVDELTLEAVINLPADSFLPYSTLSTHLLLTQNTPSCDPAFTWFLRPIYDGYSSGRGRDLTEDPISPNDLTLTERAVIALRDKPSESDFPFFIQVLTDDEKPLGILLRPNEGVNLLNVRYLPEKRDDDGKVVSSRSLLVEVQSENKREFWEIPLAVNAIPESVENIETHISERLGLDTSEPLPSPDVFQNQSIRWGKSVNQRVGGILIKVYGEENPQLMGVAIPRATLQARGYVLQPDDYLRAPELSAALRHPHRILLSIYENQRALAQRIDKLAAWLAPEKPKEYAIPASVLKQQPFGALSVTQQKIWEWIATQKNDGGSAKPFILEQIDVECGEDEKRLTLAMFEAMGLIVPITLKNPQNEKMMNFYRLAETNDQWSGSLDKTAEVEAGDA